MARAVWNGVVVAESDDTIVVDGYTYFPKDSINPELIRPSDHRSVCGWKGTASYYDVVVGDAVNPEAAWYYPDPKDKAKHVADRVSFWHGIEIEVAGAA